MEETGILYIGIRYIVQNETGIFSLIKADRLQRTGINYY